MPRNKTLDEFFSRKRIKKARVDTALATRILNALKNSATPENGEWGEPTILDVATMSEQELLDIPNLGLKGLDGLKKILKTGRLTPRGSISESCGLAEDDRGAYYTTTVHSGKKTRVIRHYV